MGATLATPEGYMSHFAHALDNGDLLVSTTKLDFIQSEFAEKKNRNALGKLSSFLWDKVAVGRVFQVNTETGDVHSEASGLGIYYDLTYVPDIGAVFSLLKLGPAFSPPFVTPAWGIAIQSTGTYAKRKMSKKFVFPPYSIGFVDYQD